MKYELVFCDYDHTLYGERDKISERNRKAIKDYVAKGGKFIICTGRAFIAVRETAKNQGLSGYIITSQGASLYDIETGNKI